MGSFTYITPYLLMVSGFVPAALSLLLIAQGASGVAGTLAIGRLLDRHPWGSLVGLFAMISVGLLGLFAFGPITVAAIAFLGLSGLSFSALAAAIQHRTMQVAPGSTDVASAATSSAFKLGIASGSLVGSVLIVNVGVRSVPLVGGLLTAGALAVVLTERRLPWFRRLAVSVTMPLPSPETVDRLRDPA
jgi:DHA1 family L-arabinose/isopropyl-beta-D-thiogalactopyranoside export protein-like MFS transporter/DHA1 family inner membrane transport protein